MRDYFTPKVNFYGNNDPETLVAQYGSPLYVYNEKIFRAACADMVHAVDYPLFRADFSVKANTNLHLLKIAREEGMHADAMSAGEAYILLQAGYKPEEILFVGNNVSPEEMIYIHENHITISVDSLDQLETYGKLFPHSDVAVRLNTGYGAGHHEYVITAGKKTKFGINDDQIKEIKKITKKYQLRICGLNQHIGSLFMEESAYVSSAYALARAAMEFKELDFIDLGGGFGIPYRKQDGERPLDLNILRERLTKAVETFMADYGREIIVRSEPGRYVCAESGVLLGRVHALKENHETLFVGTELGFNALQRVVMYSSHHDLEVYRNGKLTDEGRQTVTVVGNICESGDKLAIDRTLPFIKKGDLIGVMDAGAYGYSMASNYNSRLRPAEVLICADGSAKLIRRRDTYEDLMRAF